MVTLSPHRTVASSADPVDGIARIVLDGGIVAMPWGHPRRATYAVLCRADDPHATRRLNALKGRPGDQVLAVVGTTSVARQVADLAPDGPLGRLAASRAARPEVLLDRVFATGPVGVLLEAVAGAPAAVTKT